MVQINITTSKWLKLFSVKWISSVLTPPCLSQMFCYRFWNSAQGVDLPISIEGKGKESRYPCPSVLGQGSTVDCGFDSRRGHGRLSLVSVCVLSDKRLCVWPITRPEESYRMGVRSSVRSINIAMRRPWPELGSSAKKEARKEKNRNCLALNPLKHDFHGTRTHVTFELSPHSKHAL